MTNAPRGLQDLRRRIDAKAKAEPSWRFWGLDVHVGKMETLDDASRLAKANNGAPGSDGGRFEASEASGVDAVLQQMRDERVARTDHPMRLRQKAMPKDGGPKVRVLSMPTSRDRVVQGALKLILEPIFEADFQPGASGYRPQRSAQEAVLRVADAIVKDNTRGIDVDLQAYFDNVRQHLLVAKVAQRVSDPDILHVLKLLRKASGTPGVPHGGVGSPLRSTLSLTEVDRRLERAKEVTRRGPYTYLESGRVAEALVILGEASPHHDWRLTAGEKRLREELAVLHVTLHAAKSRIVDRATGESFGFLGFECRRGRSRAGQWRAYYPPLLPQRTTLRRKLKALFRGYQSPPLDRVIYVITPIVRGWVRYFAVGEASRGFGFIKEWVEKKVRRHVMRARNLRGFGGKRWSRRWRSEERGGFNDSRVQRPRRKALPA